MEGRNNWYEETNCLVLNFQWYVYGQTPGLNQTYVLANMPSVHDYCGQALWELIAKHLWTSPAYSLFKEILTTSIIFK